MTMCKLLRPFTWLSALVWGLLLITGCRTAGLPEGVPGYRMIPDSYPVYFSLDLTRMGEPVAELLAEADQPKTIQKMVEKGRRLWGGTSLRENPGRTSLILEGDYSSFLIGLGLTFSSEWKKPEGTAYWQNAAGQQLGVTGGDRLLYADGGMEALLDLQYPGTSSEFVPLPADEGRILETGAAVLYGRGDDVLGLLIPSLEWRGLAGWSVILDETLDDYTLLFSFSLEEEDSARFLGTTFKLMFLGLRSQSGSEEAVLTGELGLLTRLASGDIHRQGREVHISGLTISREEFKALLGNYLSGKEEGND